MLRKSREQHDFYHVIFNSSSETESWGLSIWLELCPPTVKGNCWGQGHESGQEITLWVFKPLQTRDCLLLQPNPGFPDWHRLGRCQSNLTRCPHNANVTVRGDKSQNRRLGSRKMPQWLRAPAAQSRGLEFGSQHHSNKSGLPYTPITLVPRTDPGSSRFAVFWP